MVRKRLLVEELRRKRRSDDHERYVETFRRSAVDPNPHQVDATMFALSRLDRGGALLCDEVGLGKTIEAGLIITQLRAEHRSHVLIVVPLSLARQWQVELQDLFSLPAVVIGQDTLAAVPPHGLVIVGRELAGSGRGAQALRLAGPWDLIVVDEAHELFSTIYSRYSKKTGHYDANLSRGSARRAAQVKLLLDDAPALLLTATPLQNNLFELWGLVQYVDKSNTVLGPFHEFCNIFISGEGGRQIADGMEETLRERLRAVMVRCLRSQAQPFMRQPFTSRHVTTVNFSMREAEKRLYDEVTRWLAQEQLGAYRASQRKLMALQLRRRMASSLDALAASLSNLKARMHHLLDDDTVPLLTADELGLEEDEAPPAYDPVLLAQDLAEVTRLEGMALHAVGLEDEKKRLLKDVIDRIGRRAFDGVVSDKVVVFTESLRTLETLLEYLEAHGLAGQVTCFSGTNDRPAALQALSRWETEVGAFLTSHPEPAAAIRGALVHEFKTRTRVLLATEAGAKGLNLQFCNALVNYDLPWNPQRIEQRIGRVHRYGQRHDVVIINFINLDNAAEARVHRLLAEKLDVFRGLFGASDDILGALGGRLDFEQRINDVLDRCATPEAIQAAFDRLALELDEAGRRAHDAKLAHTRSLVSRLDGTVQARLKHLEGALAPALSRRDEMLATVLEAEVLGSDGPRTLLQWQGSRYHLGPPQPGEPDGSPLDLSHPQVQAVFDEIVGATAGRVLPGSAPFEVYRITLRGLEEEERIVLIGAAVLDGWPVFASVEDAVQAGRADAEGQQARRVERLLAQLRGRREDAQRYVDQQTRKLQEGIERAARARRMAASAADAEKARQQHVRLQQERDRYRTQGDAALRDSLRALDAEERQIRQQRYVETSTEWLFSIRPEGEVLAGQGAKVGRSEVTDEAAPHG